MRALGIAAAVALLSCAEHAARMQPAPGPGPTAPADGSRLRAPQGPPVSEIEARAVLEDRFRSRGLRVLVDVPVQVGDSRVTLDGYDPDRRIGFEYVAVEERATDLSAAERAELERAGELRVLVLDAMSATDIAARAEQFLTETVIN